MITTVRTDTLKVAGRIVGRYASAETARKLIELAQAVGDGPERAFKGPIITAAQNVSFRVLADLRSGAAPREEVETVAWAFGAMRKTTSGQDLIPFWDGLREGGKAPEHPAPHPPLLVKRPPCSAPGDAPLRRAPRRRSAPGRRRGGASEPS